MAALSRHVSLSARPSVWLSVFNSDGYGSSISWIDGLQLFTFPHANIKPAFITRRNWENLTLCHFVIQQKDVVT